MGGINRLFFCNWGCTQIRLMWCLLSGSRGISCLVVFIRLMVNCVSSMNGPQLIIINGCMRYFDEGRSYINELHPTQSSFKHVCTKDKETRVLSKRQPGHQLQLTGYNCRMCVCVTPSAVKIPLRFLPSSNTVSVPITGFTFPFVHRVLEHVLYRFLYNDFRGAQKIPFVICALASLIIFFFLKFMNIMS
jgi:hypothetical protein